MQTRNKRVVIALSLLLFMVMGIYSACRKADGAAQPLADIKIENARSWLEGEVVKKEREMLSLRKMQTRQDTLKRTFARMGRISKSLNWNAARRFDGQGMELVIVPLEQQAQPFKDKSYTTSRTVVFFTDFSGNRDLQIIEVLSKSAAVYDAVELSRQAFLNHRTGSSSAIQGLNANILLYDRDYIHRGSYQVQNGAWSKSGLVLGFKKAYSSPRRIMATMSQSSSCSNCTTWYLVGFWYDMQTGEVVDYDILTEWYECTEQPDSPEYGDGVSPTNNTECMDECLDKSDELSGGIQQDNTTVSVDDQALSPIRKFRSIKWRVLKNVTWNIYSYEKGVVRLDDPETDRWVWEYIEHDRMSLEGIVLGGTVEIGGVTATPSFTPGTPNVLYAGMQLVFDVNFTPLCGSCPVVSEVIKSYSISYTVSNIWPAKP